MPPNWAAALGTPMTANARYTTIQATHIRCINFSRITSPCRSRVSSVEIFSGNGLRSGEKLTESERGCQEPESRKLKCNPGVYRRAT